MWTSLTSGATRVIINKYWKDQKNDIQNGATILVMWGHNACMYDGAAAELEVAPQSVVVPLFYGVWYVLSSLKLFM